MEHRQRVIWESFIEHYGNAVRQQGFDVYDLLRGLQRTMQSALQTATLRKQGADLTEAASPYMVSV